MSKECKQCCLLEGIILNREILIQPYMSCDPFDKRITINDQGVCQLCEEYNKNFNEQFVREELQQFLDLPTTSEEYDAIVSFSGGKDSASALYLAVEKFGLKAIAFLYDNGFIPASVQDRAQRFCDKLGVPLKIVRNPLYDLFLQGMTFDQKTNEWSNPVPKDLCRFCCQKFFSAVLQFAKSEHINRVITGLNTYISLETKCSSIFVNSESWLIALPYAMRLTVEGQKKLLQEMQWEDIRIEGYTSNCLVPGFTNGFFKKAYGCTMDIAYLAKEVRSGYMTKEGLKVHQEKDLAADIPHQAISDFLKDAKSRE